MSAALKHSDVLIVGAGPAGVMAALRAGDLGARTTLLSPGAFGGMAANDGPVPVRTLAHAARLLRDARQLPQYGIVGSDPRLDYPRMLNRVRAVVEEVRVESSLRRHVEAAGVDIREKTGFVRFADDHMMESADGHRFRADKIVLCTGGTSRRLPLPGFELTATHSDAWSLTEVPRSMIVIGGGATGAQVASVFNAFGTAVQLFEAGGRILSTEEAEVSSAVAIRFRASGIEIHENFGKIDAFEKTPEGIRMLYTKAGVQSRAEAALAVVAVGWVADTAKLELGLAGVDTDARGFIRIDAYLRSSAPHIFAAGDVIGGLMLAPQALQEGFVAATNAVRGPDLEYTSAVNPIGSYTDPEYAQVGMSEAAARDRHDAEVVMVGFDNNTRAIIDGRVAGFCKLIVDRASGCILGCHLVGERAVELAQIAAIAIASGMKVDDFARIPLSFPTYAGILGRASMIAARRLAKGLNVNTIGPTDLW